MSETMIERVAKVLSPNSWESLNTSCDTKAKKKRRVASLDYAKRCIEAMREPTEEMLDAAMADEEKGHWQAMIDAALKD